MVPWLLVNVLREGATVLLGAAEPPLNKENVPEPLAVDLDTGAFFSAMSTDVFLLRLLFPKNPLNGLGGLLDLGFKEAFSLIGVDKLMVGLFLAKGREGRDGFGAATGFSFFSGREDFELKKEPRRDGGLDFIDADTFLTESFFGTGFVDALGGGDCDLAVGFALNNESRNDGGLACFVGDFSVTVFFF